MAERETYTIYITSNDAEATRCVVVPLSIVKLIILSSAIVVVLLLGTAFDYIGLTQEQGDRDKTKADHEYLSANLQFVESQLASLEKQLGNVGELADKIEVIQEYYNRGPVATMATPTEYFTVDYVATGETVRTSKLDEPSDRAFLQKEIGKVPSPFIEMAYSAEVFAIDKMSERIELAVQNTQVMERRVMQLWENLSERQNFIRATPSVRPARGWFSSRFGIRADPYTGRPTMHSGLDIAARYGSTVFATADGIVKYVGYQSGYGNVVTIDHGYGIQSRYAHNSRIYVKVGEEVRRYDRIAAVGNTGRSTGPHVHYEIRVRGVAVDPINYILDF